MEDKIDERTHAIEIYGDKSRNRISKFMSIIDCDVQIRELLLECEEAIRDLKIALSPMIKKYHSLNPEQQNDIKQKEKIVELIEDQLESNKSNFNNEDFTQKIYSNELNLKKLGITSNII